jgi:hypothetical protein
MPLAESVQPQRDKNSGNTRPVGLVTCPNCRVVMPRISLKLAEEENDLNEAGYRCPKSLSGEIMLDCIVFSA